MSNWGRAVIISIFVLFLLLCPSGSAEIMPMTIDYAGNLVSAENSIFSIEIDYSTDGTTYANITSKTFTGGVDFGIGYNSHEINGIESIDLYSPHVVELDPSTHSHTFYYVTGFTPRIAEPLDYGNEYNPQQYVVQHKVFAGYDNESNNSIWTPTTSVVAFDSQVNDGANYTATWHTEHSRVEDWVNLGRFGVFERDYDGKDIWMITQNRHIEAGQSYQLRIVGDVPIRFGEHSYKFDFMIKPSSESLSQAILNNHLYVIDPLWNSSYDIRLKMPINNTAGAGQLTNFQVNTNISAYSANASSLRCYNRTTGSIMAHWNESVVSGNVHELWTNNSVVASGRDNNTFCAWQTTPTASSSSDGNATFIAWHGTATAAYLDSLLITPSNIIWESEITLPAGTNDNRHGISNNANFGADDSICMAQYDNGAGDQIVYAPLTWNEGSASYSTTSEKHTGTTRFKFTLLSGTLRAYVNGVEKTPALTSGIADETMGLGIQWINGAYTAPNQTWAFARKGTANEPTYESLELEYYIPSLYYNTTPVLNTIYSSPHEYALNESSTGKTNTNWTANSTGITDLKFTTAVTPSGYTNFTIAGDNLDNFTTWNLTASTQYNLKNSSGTVESQTTNADGNATFEVDLISGDYWIFPTTTTSYTVSGTIYGAAGLGEGQVTVTLGTDSTTTSSNGSYSFTGVSAGTYTLSASKPGLQDTFTTIIVSSDTTQDLTMARAESPAGGGQESSDWWLPFNISGPISRLDGLFAPLQVPSDPGKINLFWYFILGFGAFMFVDGTAFRFDKSHKAPIIKLKYLISAPLSFVMMFLGLLYLGLINWNSAFFISTFDGLALSFISAISPILGVSSPLGAVGYVLVGSGILVLGVLFFIDGLAFCVDKSRENTFLKIKYQVLIAAGLGLGVLGAAISGLIIFY